jgi:hypothetical protein
MADNHDATTSIMNGSGSIYVNKVRIYAIVDVVSDSDVTADGIRENSILTACVSKQASSDIEARGALSVITGTFAQPTGKSADLVVTMMLMSAFCFRKSTMTVRQEGLATWQASNKITHRDVVAVPADANRAVHADSCATSSSTDPTLEPSSQVIPKSV